jgi:hypothetical protein
MKTLFTALGVACLTATTASAATVIYTETFGSASSSWQAPTGTSAPTSSGAWSGSEGNPAGSTILTASHFQNPSPSVGSEVHFLYQVTGLDFGSGPVTIAFDAKLLGALPGTAIHAFYNGNFVPVIMNSLNTSSYTTFSQTFNLSQGFTATSTLNLDIMFAMGPVAGAGGSMAIDNITVSTTVVPEPSAFALAGVGLAGLVFARRRAKQ